MEPDAQEVPDVCPAPLQVLQGALQRCYGVVAEGPVLDGLVAQQQVAIPAAMRVSAS
jgi:hypothetical protein